MRMMNKKPTTARMGKILTELDITRNQFEIWCGLKLKQWIEYNPTWTEKEWYDLVSENTGSMKNG